MFNFKISKERQEELSNNCNFTEIEIFIFNEIVKGTKRKDVQKKVREKYGLCERTTQRKLKGIVEKIGNYDMHTQDRHKVYIHKFPNGKKYVGVCMNCESRWRNGLGYIDNKEMYEAIKKYGWDNIEHKIILETSDNYIAYTLEKVLIEELDLINNGYNNQ